jgi:predicted HNH restriction endonuclease
LTDHAPLDDLFVLEAPRLTILADVAVVCAHCHAMIHLGMGGECRALQGLIVD